MAVYQPCDTKTSQNFLQIDSYFRELDSTKGASRGWQLNIQKSWHSLRHREHTHHGILKYWANLRQSNQAKRAPGTFSSSREVA